MRQGGVRLVKTMRDGLLLEFSSVVAAVECVSVRRICAPIEIGAL
jgi:class 3 adenylate cyclase